MADFVTFLPLIKSRLDRWGIALTTDTRIRRIATVKDNEKKLIVWDADGQFTSLDLHETLP